MLPLSSPFRQYRSNPDMIRAAITRALSSGQVILGEENLGLSDELALYLGVSKTVLVGNGTDALEIALTSVGAEAGSTVLTVANAGGYATTAIRQIGATPMYVEVDPATLQMSPRDLESRLLSADKRPSAIIVTHLFGKAADITAIAKVSASHQIPLIEDCAQSLGATVDGKKLGSFGAMATTSFYPTKNLGALGDGGAIFTNSQELAQKASMLRQYGWSSKYYTAIRGGRNSRLDEIQAAVLRFRLPLLDDMNQRRRDIFARYKSVTSPFGVLAHDVGADFVCHLAVLICDDREQVQRHFKSKDISTDIHYPVPDHLQPAYRDELGTSLPVTEALAQRILSIPLFPEMEEEEIQMVMETLSG